MGGSQGARSINECAIAAFAGRAGRDFDVLHLAGRRDYPALSERLAPRPATGRYTLLAYEPDLGDCLAACDLVLGRSGGSIFESPRRGGRRSWFPIRTPTADHQTANAAWMAEAARRPWSATRSSTGAARRRGRRPARRRGAAGGDVRGLGRARQARRARARIADEVLAAAGAA